MQEVSYGIGAKAMEKIRKDKKEQLQEPRFFRHRVCMKAMLGRKSDRPTCSGFSRKLWMRLMGRHEMSMFRYLVGAQDVKLHYTGLIAHQKSDTIFVLVKTIRAL